MISEKAQSVPTTLATDVALSSHDRVQRVKLDKIARAPEPDWESRLVFWRIRAGIWSARTALVLSVPFAITAWAHGVEQVWFMYMLLPVTAAFFAGVFVGAAIGNREEVTDESLAGRCGVLTALLTYVLFALEVASLNDSWLESGLNALMGSLLMTGWAVFPVAFLAGILAFRTREGADRLRHHTEA